MRNIQTFCIAITICLMANVKAKPTETRRYKHLGYSSTAAPNIGNVNYNGSSIQTSNQLPISPTIKAKNSYTSTPSTPHFEYVLLGQDPKDQEWYRLSLVPKVGKSSLKAQISTRIAPPYDKQQTLKHDKTIKQLVEWLESTEERNLIKVYKDMLENDEELKRKNDEDIVIPADSAEYETRSQLDRENNGQLLLVDGGCKQGPTNSTEDEPKVVNNFVYFIKGLK
ncbi:uncharacterized protein LOC115626615 [Scaptodrosophila lebanonensis]|uniref:Uncharacterized protein LOC115626615 n=1 Tax=Drosophila lebanonensis TaxID=7225 RepID=A0A6J2TRX5_DROLE|nr:uncharacterized protein LOC115626615 [Scaptodrosophila lebanonensis]